MRIGQWVTVTAAPSLRVGPGRQPVQVESIFDEETITVVSDSGKRFMLSYDEGDRWEPVTAENAPLVALLNDFSSADDLTELLDKYSPDPELMKEVAEHVCSSRGLVIASDPRDAMEQAALGAVAAVADAVHAGATSDDELEGYYSRHSAAPLEKVEAQLLAIRLALICAESRRRSWLIATRRPGVLAWNGDGDESAAKAACLVNEGLNVLVALIESDE